jgi:putative transcriptional regulator
MGKGPPQITNSIRTLRFHADEMTQAELAERVGVTRQTILAIEQGRYSPSLEVAFRIAAVFGVPIQDVFHYQGVLNGAATKRGAP